MTDILKDLLDEYELKRLTAQRKADKFKDELDIKYPELAKINEEIAQKGISISKEILRENDPKLINKLQNDIENLKEKKQNFLKKQGITSDDLKPHYECLKCSDTGYINQKGYNVMCPCLKQKLINISYNKSNIAHLDKGDFSTFNACFFSDKVDKEKYLSPLSPRQNIEKIYTDCQNFIKDFNLPETKSLFFMGKTGLGKTFFSNCIAKEILKKGKIVLYQTSSILLDTIVNYKFSKNNTSGYNSSSYGNSKYGAYNNSNYSPEENDFIKNVYDCDLLIIDDLGTESINSVKSTELFNIINTRILTNKKTIISTNLTLRNIQDRYDERITSRIIGYYLIRRFFGDDIRLELAKMQKRKD